MLETILIIVVLAVLFDISNGWNDSANAIATVVSTRVLSPLQAVILSAFMNILGAFSSTAVAKTIGHGIVAPESVSNVVVGSALLSSFLWNSAMTLYRASTRSATGNNSRNSHAQKLHMTNGNKHNAPG